MIITQFNELWRAVNRIKIDQIARTEIGIFENEGLDTDLSDIYSNSREELFTVLKDGTIRKTIVHICDISSYREEWSLPKFHIFECLTLKSMRINGKKHRYKKASRNDGKFWIIKKSESGYETLNICRHDCLKQHNSVYRENMNVDDFDIKKYMEKPMQHVSPYINDDLDMTTRPKSYTKNWKEISDAQKKYHGWICQECFDNLSAPNMKQYLHTHHIDADLDKNLHENLKVLCIECHAKQFQHGHIKQSPQYKAFIQIKESHASQ